MRNRGLRLLLVMVAALIVAFLAAQYVHTRRTPVPADLPEELLEAVFDRIGVTQWAEALEWYALQEEGAEMPVWIARHGTAHFHSIPLCGGMKDPVQMTLADALAEGFTPCPICWVAETTENAL